MKLNAKNFKLVWFFLCSCRFAWEMPEINVQFRVSSLADVICFFNLALALAYLELYQQRETPKQWWFTVNPPSATLAQHYPSTVLASGAVCVYGLCLLVSLALVLSEEMASVLPSSLMGAILSILVTLHSWHCSMHILQPISNRRWLNFGSLFSM